MPLSNKNLDYLPETIDCFAAKECFDLDRNNLSDLPKSFANLDNLYVLDLSYNKFTSFPEVITKLSQLEQLYFHHNSITAIPSSIANLRELDYLMISHNHLSELPDELNQLSLLHHLDVSFNHIQSIENLELPYLSSSYPLINLKFNDNPIRSISEQFFNASDLNDHNAVEWHDTEWYLNFNNTLIDFLPKLPKVIDLRLMNTPIANFPDLTNNISSGMEYLNIQGTNIEMIPSYVKDIFIKIVSISDENLAHSFHPNTQVHISPPYS